MTKIMHSMSILSLQKNYSLLSSHKWKWISSKIITQALDGNKKKFSFLKCEQKTLLIFCVCVFLRLSIKSSKWRLAQYIQYIPLSSFLHSIAPLVAFQVLSSVLVPSLALPRPPKKTDIIDNSYWRHYLLTLRLISFSISCFCVSKSISTRFFINSSTRFCASSSTIY